MSLSDSKTASNSYDIVIVGAGVAGCALAWALAHTQRPQPFRICLLERSLAEPDRIVGELLQPGGLALLQTLGLDDCVQGIDAAPAYGYCVVLDGSPVHVPYPRGRAGCGFHHGRFIQALRAKARAAPGVELVEANVTGLVECPMTGRVLGVRAARKVEGEAEGEGSAQGHDVFYADLTVVADGCFSAFRSAVMGPAAAKPTVKSHFVGLVLQDARLPIEKHGTVVLVKGHGPVLLYQIADAAHETRMLVDVKEPLPKDMKAHIADEILPQLPSALHVPVMHALQNDRVRRMPNSWLPPAAQGAHKQGVLLVGDSWNMRHPLTGGGMMCAFNDVVILQQLFAGVRDLSDWKEMSALLHTWHWQRKPLAATVNVLSLALYNLFGADDDALAVLRNGCFKYFERGGDCITGPVSLLAGITPSFAVLFKHFFAVAFYSIWVMFTHAQPVLGPDEKVTFVVPGWEAYPYLLLKSLQVFWTACIVFVPLMWGEMRWW